MLWSHIGILMRLHAAEHSSADPVFEPVGLAGFKREVNTFYWPKLLDPFSYSLFFIFLLSFYI